jgi:hypothetical protein
MGTSIDINQKIELTTTGTSGAATLVGATLNIPQYSGGGGLQGAHVLLPVVTGTVVNVVVNSSIISTTNTINNRLLAIPFFPNNSFTTSNLFINVTVLGVAVSGRILIYSSLNGKPDQKLYESADLDCSTTGIKTATTSFNFTAGVAYFICTQFNGIAGTAGYSNASLMNLYSTGSIIISAYFITVALGSAPLTFGPYTTTASTVPAVFITVA